MKFINFFIIIVSVFASLLAYTQTIDNPIIEELYIIWPSNDAILLGEDPVVHYYVDPYEAKIKIESITSSDPSIIEVEIDKYNNVFTRGKKLGVATVTVTMTNGQVFSKELTVGNFATGVEIDIEEMEKVIPVGTVPVGFTCTIPYTLIPSNVDNETVTWKSSNPDVISVDENGTICALKTYDHPVYIYVTAFGGSYAWYSLSVRDEINVVDITPTESRVNGKVGDTYQIELDFYPTYTTVDMSDIIFKVVNNKNAVTVSETGLVTFLGEGEVTISIYYMSIYGFGEQYANKIEFSISGD